MTKIIIQGAGFVGNATYNLLMDVGIRGILFNDPYKHQEYLSGFEDGFAPKGGPFLTPDDEWKTADWVIICVPTNLDETKNPPENSIENVHDAIKYAHEKGYRGTYVVRSTLSINGVFELHDVLHDKFILWPEYIREKHWAEDSVNPRQIVIGMNSVEGVKFGEIFRKHRDIIHYTTPLEAQLAKLATNTFLAMKVIFANQLYQLTQCYSCDYDRIAQVLANEGRLGNTHWTVPGPDGKLGFGGTCFPKDSKTFESALKRHSIDDTLITAINEMNDKIRKE